MAFAAVAEFEPGYLTKLYKSGFAIGALSKRSEAVLGNESISPYFVPYRPNHKIG